MVGYIYVVCFVVLFEFLLMVLFVSGGYMELVYMKEDGFFEIVGEICDDVVGEVYDKVGWVLGLFYFSGKEIDVLVYEGIDIY